MTSRHCPLLLWLLRTNEFCLDQFVNFCYDPHSPGSSVFSQPSKLADAQFLQGREVKVNCNNGLQLLLCCRSWAAVADCCHFICLWTSLWPHGKELQPSAGKNITPLIITQHPAELLKTSTRQADSETGSSIQSHINYTSATTLLQDLFKPHSHIFNKALNNGVRL